MELKEGRDNAKFLTMVTDEPLSEEEASALVTMEGNMAKEPAKPTPTQLAEQIDQDQQRIENEQKQVIADKETYKVPPTEEERVAAANEKRDQLEEEMNKRKAALAETAKADAAAGGGVFPRAGKPYSPEDVAEIQRRTELEAAGIAAEIKPGGLPLSPEQPPSQPFAQGVNPPGRVSARTQQEIDAGRRAVEGKPPPPRPPEPEVVNPTVELDPSKVPGFRDSKGKPVETA